MSTTINYEYDISILEPCSVDQTVYETNCTAAFVKQWPDAVVIISQGSDTWATSSDMMIAEADVITISDNVLGLLCEGLMIAEADVITISDEEE